MLNISNLFWAVLTGLPLIVLISAVVLIARRKGPGPFLTGFGAIALFAWCLIGWAFVIEPRLLVVKQVDVFSARWPGRDLRIGIISDIHAGGFHMDPERLRLVVRRMNAQRPDLVVLLGDFAGATAQDSMKTPEGRNRTMAAFPELAMLKAQYGVYGVLGNYDWWFHAPHIQEGLTDANIPDLENRAVRIDRAGGAFWLAGITDETSPVSQPSWTGALEAVPDGAPTLAISHRPDVYGSAPADRVILTMAGHSHCGQVRLPLVGAIGVASEGARRWTCGLYERDRSFLYVTGGLGFSVVPVRFLQPPEIVILTLTSGRANGRGRDGTSALQAR
jgi:predicted MPP superfamily phosphohydrolase